jgi:hypothetical protein
MGHNNTISTPKDSMLLDIGAETLSFRNVQAGRANGFQLSTET